VLPLLSCCRCRRRRRRGSFPASSAAPCPREEKNRRCQCRRPSRRQQ
jgi:hypothetical protein